MAHEKIYGFCENKCKVELPVVAEINGKADNWYGGALEILCSVDVPYPKGFNKNNTHFLDASGMILLEANKVYVRNLGDSRASINAELLDDHITLTLHSSDSYVISNYNSTYKPTISAILLRMPE